MDKRFKTSQYDQDSIIEQLCYPNGDENHKGIFIEVGAWDGVEISNTYWLEKCKDWDGLLVEPIESRAESARHNRWCKVWQGCVYDRNAEVDFLHVIGYSEMLSGIEEAYHSRNKDRIYKEIDQHKQLTEMIKIQSKTINGLCDFHDIKGADLLSLDTQTSELAVLKAYDIKKHPIKCILLDFNGVNVTELEQWFNDNGYKLHWKHDSADERLYVHPDIKWTWD